jgi:hypothetical protein
MALSISAGSIEVGCLLLVNLSHGYGASVLRPTAEQLDEIVRESRLDVFKENKLDEIYPVKSMAILQGF